MGEAGYGKPALPVLGEELRARRRRDTPPYRWAVLGFELGGATSPLVASVGVERFEH